jgi:hypothetical protein
MHGDPLGDVSSQSNAMNYMLNSEINKFVGMHECPVN